MGDFIRAFQLRQQPLGSSPNWVMKVPAVQALTNVGTLSLTNSVTVLTGNNGVGKSTLLKSLARSYGFALHGGPFGYGPPGPQGDLHNCTRVQLGSRSKEGYFLRAETHFSQANSFRDSAPGVTNLHHMSHGESVMQVVESFHKDGLYILDEPESGLSAIRQMALLATLHRLSTTGSQIILATHSPILLAIPSANLVEIHEDGTWSEHTELQDTVAFRALDEFFADPAGISQFMIEVTKDQ
ncbi:AAA family ATPase [Corynebacterium lubricantis]|uniref:AAA family ATPase n=1 Tax=Corynebacterium lubricantis TaxID=541095 RepID=UPI0004772257|nr:AAA family ATPase [Corynebacterium lubricantis]